MPWPFLGLNQANSCKESSECDKLFRQMPAMTNAKFKALRAALEGFSEIQKQVSIIQFGDEALLEAIHALVERTNKSVRGTLPDFNQLAYGGDLGAIGIRMHGVRAYVASVVPILRLAIENEGTITADLLDFAYVANTHLRAILQRDYRDLQRAIAAKFWKGAVILSGGLLEALLADQLLSHGSKAISAASAPKKNPDILSWRFVELIAVSAEIGIVSKGAERLSHSVREYRNLVHPHKELRDKLVANEPEAKIALQVLHLVDRDLSA